MQTITLILPHQLFKIHPALDLSRPVILVELDYFFTRYSFHKHKLVLHRASMRAYYEQLKKQGYVVKYYDHKKVPSLTKLCALLHKKNIAIIHHAELIEHALNHELAQAVKKYSLEHIEYISPYFMTERARLSSFFKPKKKQYLMAAFYRQQRLAYNILITKSGKPVGGKWSFDTLNRKPLPRQITVPAVRNLGSTKYTQEAMRWVEKNFKHNPGSTKTFWYPTTSTQAQRWLQIFLKERLALFGSYEDAIDKNNHVLFHAVLSPLLNIGLLTPEHVIQKTLAFAQTHHVPINSLEGFIRQIIGWREFMYGMYLFHALEQQNSNYFSHKRKLPYAFWNATTRIDPVDSTINTVLNTSYAHHIERLMVLGNFMLLCQYKPSNIFDWFMELFIDSYDWVMVPNVYGMSQYADGGLLATKPYISSSKYILKMSNYKKNSWCAIWDSLFWYFIHTHLVTFSANPRCAFMARTWERMDAKKRREHIICAQRFLNSL